MGGTQVGEGRFVRRAGGLGCVFDFCTVPSLFFSKTVIFILWMKLPLVPPLRARTGVGRDVWPPKGTKWGWGQQSKEWESVRLLARLRG